MSGKKKATKKKATKKKAPAKKKPVAKKKAPAKKKAAKKKAPKKPPAKKKATKKKSGDGPVVTPPKAINEEQMLASMGRIKLGMPIDLDYGMQIVRKKRDGSEIAVTLTKSGYEYKGKLFSSLSAAAMAATGTPCRSGNDLFSLVTSSCTEVRNKNGKVIAKKGM